MTDNDTSIGQVRHWLVTNLSTESDGSLSMAQGTQISPYIGLAPLPNYIAPRPHWYVFILARGTGKVDVTPEDLRELQKPYAAAMAGNQGEAQDLKDRWGFNAQEMIAKKGLKVQAVNFMRVGGTLKSAAANMAMTGQAMVNKVRFMVHLNGGINRCLLTRWRLGCWAVRSCGIVLRSLLSFID